LLKELKRGGVRLINPVSDGPTRTLHKQLRAHQKDRETDQTLNGTQTQTRRLQ